MPPTPSICAAIRGRLLAQPAVVAWVNQRVYTLKFPQSLTAPAIRLQEIDRIAAMQLRGDTGLRQSRVQIDAVESEAHGDPYANAHAIAVAIRGDLTTGTPSGLIGFRGTLSGIPIAAIMPADERERYDAETGLILVEQDFFVWFGQ